MSEIFKIEKWIQQGFILSPTLFNIYFENVFRKTVEESDDGITVHAQLANSIRYADDTVLLWHGFQRPINNILETCNEYGMKLNCKKLEKWLSTRTTTYMGS